MSLPPPPVSSLPAGVHGDGGGVPGATAEQQLPGLGTERGPRFRPSSEATHDMAEGGGGVGGGEKGDGALALVLALAAQALPAVVSRLEAAVPRKARSCLPRAVPSTWWSCRIPVLLPPLAREPVAAVEEEEVRMFPRRQRGSVTPSPYPAPPAAKRARSCLHCDAGETPRWRPGPMGKGTLCNACGVWYSTTGALPEHRPPASPVTESLPESPIWELEVPGAIYLVRKSATQRRPPWTEAAPTPQPRTETAPAPLPRTTCLHCGSPETPKWTEGPMGLREVCNSCGSRYKKGRLLPECRPATSPLADSPPENPIWKPDARPAVYLARKPAKQRKPPAPRTEATSAPGKRNKNRTCVHCGSSETPQWREGPMGRGTLCNACGVRYKQGRLLPEYRPMASPTFVPSEHASSHRRVLELHRKQQGNGHHLPPPPSKHASTRRRAPKLRKKRKCKDQHLRASPPVDGVVNPEDRPIDTPCSSSDHPAGSTPGRANVLAGAASSLDLQLLEGPSAPFIVESDQFVIS